MPSVKTGEKQADYMHRCVPQLIKEGKKQDQAVAQCLNMFKEHWKAKGVEIVDGPNPVFTLDLSKAKVATYCDNCKSSIDTSKPKKPKAGEKPQVNPSIEATLETGTDTGETKQYHFCDEECLRQYLNKRNKK